MDIIANIWAGRAGLAKTYWGWGILGGVIWGAVLALVTPGSPAAMAAFLAFCAYFLIVNTGVWRAATAYTGPTTWAMLAKVAAGLGYAIVIGSLVMVLITLGGGSLRVPHANHPPQAVQQPQPAGTKPFTYEEAAGGASQAPQTDRFGGVLVDSGK